MAILYSTNLCKAYVKERDITYALLDCNIAIKEGECVVISGSKNSGKTTLLHLLGGYEKPSCGTVYIKDNDISLMNEDELAMIRRKDIGYFTQSDSLIKELNVHENIILPLILAGKKYDEDYYRELTNRLHISGILTRYPKELTVNQLRCVAYARALIHKPDIILMDEAIGDMFYQMDKEVLDYLLDIVYRFHKTLIMVTNDPEVSVYADHIIKLRKGVIVEDKTL